MKNKFFVQMRLRRFAHNDKGDRFRVKHGMTENNGSFTNDPYNLYFLFNLPMLCVLRGYYIAFYFFSVICRFRNLYLYQTGNMYEDRYAGNPIFLQNQT